MENLSPVTPQACFYQVNYTLTEVPDDCAYFHAQFRRTNPLPYLQPYAILDGVRGRGHYVGTAMGVGVNSCGWWGEGEVKFYIDGDGQFPTICGTGTEDYFGGSYNWDVDGKYVEYTTAFLGMHQVIRPDGLYNSQHRHSMYRWHVMDPVRFSSDLRVTIDALGWRSEGRFHPGQHDMCSVAYWYQTLPAAAFPALPSRMSLRWCSAAPMSDSLEAREHATAHTQQGDTTYGNRTRASVEPLCSVLRALRSSSPAGRGRTIVMASAGWDGTPLNEVFGTDAYFEVTPDYGHSPLLRGHRRGRARGSTSTTIS